jgi:hypothetical protein
MKGGRALRSCLRRNSRKGRSISNGRCKEIMRKPDFEKLLITWLILHRGEDPDVSP